MTGGRRVAGAFSLSPVPWAQAVQCPQHRADHIRSHFYPNHCLQSPFKKYSHILSVFSRLKKTLLSNVLCEVTIIRVQRQFQRLVLRDPGADQRRGGGAEHGCSRFFPHRSHPGRHVDRIYFLLGAFPWHSLPCVTHFATAWHFSNSS